MTEKDKRHNITLLANYALIASAETLTSHAVDLCDYFKRGKGVTYYEQKMRENVNDLGKRLRFHEWEVNNAYGDTKQLLCDILDYYNEEISPDVVKLKCAVHNFVGRHVHTDAETIAMVETGRILSAVHVETVKESAQLFAHGEQSDGGKTLMWRRIVSLYTLKPVTWRLGLIAELAEKRIGIPTDIDLNTDKAITDGVEIIRRKCFSPQNINDAARYAAQYAY